MAASRTARRRRLRLLGMGSIAALVVIVFRLVAVQVFDAKRYVAYAAGETEQRVALPATRGAIYDRNGNLLALSVPTVEVVADDFQIAHPAREAGELAPLLHQPAARLAKLLAEHNGYVVLTPDAATSVAGAGEALALAGISYLPSTERTSPDATLFEPLLGGLDAAGNGVTGLEDEEQSLLAGRPGTELVAEAPGDVQLPSGTSVVRSPRQGKSLVLTIDEPLQVEVTKDLAAEIASQHAHSGVAVVTDVRTGAVLAMVDLVTGPKGEVEPSPENLAVTSVYEPGSVMKLATFSYALKDGLITPQSTFVVPFAKELGGYTFEDAEYHPTQVMTASEILAQSSNIGTIEVAARLGMTRLGQAFHALGFGQPTGLGWPGESDGIVGSPADWVGSDAGSVPIGTGVAVTPMQILDAYSAEANGGVMERPHLVQATVSANGTETPYRSGPAHRVLPADVAHELVPMLEGVVQDGTAVCAEVPGYSVAGKTGTAQALLANGTYSSTDYNATFVGFVPAQSPKLAAIVTLNDPSGIYGGSVAAPVFSKIMEYALRRFDVAPIGAPTPSPLACTSTSGQ